MRLSSFSYFSVQGSEKGGEAETTQKATLFPSGSALHPTMNGVLKNTTLGTRLFFNPNNWAICPRVSSGLLVRPATETAVVLERCAGVKIPTSQFDAQLVLCGLLAPMCWTYDNETVKWERAWMKTQELLHWLLFSVVIAPMSQMDDSVLTLPPWTRDHFLYTLQWLKILTPLHPLLLLPPAHQGDERRPCSQCHQVPKRFGGF